MEIVRAVLLHNGRLQRVTEPTAPDHRAAGYLTKSCECYFKRSPPFAGGKSFYV